MNANITGLRVGGIATLVVATSTPQGHQSQTINITANGQATVATGLSAGTTYSVTLGSKPDFQTCTLNGVVGKVVANTTVSLSMACTENPMFAYAANQVGHSIAGFAIDTATGALS
jgi:hypothetical protein